MQRIIQINLSGRLIPIEEDAYLLLRDYVKTLERQFEKEPGKDEIIQDIETRIAELFGIRLQTGAPCIDTPDVSKVIETLGPAYKMGANDEPVNPYLPEQYSGQKGGSQNNYTGHRRIFRNPNDKLLGGVCSGVANYFEIDPVIIRLVMATLFFCMGIGLLAYLISWIVIPVARTPEQMAQMSGGVPLNFYDIKRNVGVELQDLKKRAEEMSKELKDFFSKKK
jgi:phage shock protein C